jgi:hypothetical protein
VATYFLLPPYKSKMQSPMVLSPYMRNPIIYLNYVPEDVMRLLNTFLDADSRANLNPILNPMHRHHMKFPTDFALHHAIVTYVPAQRAIARSLINIIDILDDLNDHPIINAAKIKETKKKALKILRSYVIFLYSSHGHTLIQYRSGSKEGALRDLRTFISDESTLNSFIRPKLREGIEQVIEDIEDVPFIRHVVVPANFRKSYYP